MTDDVPRSTEPLLVAEEITAGYLPGVNILEGTSLELYPGEMVGVIGPNGAGKSTLIKALFGLVEIRDGAVFLQGEDITNKPAHELVSIGVGYVPQNNNVFPRLTIEENLRMGVYLRPRDYDEQVAIVSELFPSSWNDAECERTTSQEGNVRCLPWRGR